MNADRLLQLQRDLGWGRDVATFIPEINFPDYALPTREWIAGDFSAALTDEFETRGLNTYIDLKNICVMFAKKCQTFAWDCNTLTPGQPLPLLWGELGYMKQQQDAIPIGHRITFTFVNENGVEVPVFYEPQLQAIVQLSDDEIWSIHKSEA